MFHGSLRGSTSSFSTGHAFSRGVMFSILHGFILNRVKQGSGGRRTPHSVSALLLVLFFKTVVSTQMGMGRFSEWNALKKNTEGWLRERREWARCWLIVETICKLEYPNVCHVANRANFWHRLFAFNTSLSTPAWLCTLTVSAYFVVWNLHFEKKSPSGLLTAGEVITLVVHEEMEPTRTREKIIELQGQFVSYCLWLQPLKITLQHHFCS